MLQNQNLSASHAAERPTAKERSAPVTRGMLHPFLSCVNAVVSLDTKSESAKHPRLSVPLFASTAVLLDTRANHAQSLPVTLSRHLFARDAERSDTTLTNVLRSRSHVL